MSRNRRLFHEELELLAPVLSPTEADRCQVIGEGFIDGRCCHPPEAELLKVVLTRFQARTNYWREVSWLLPSQGK
ncbi:hypothetical protein D3C81_385780 [compost metagenome]